MEFIVREGRPEDFRIRPIKEQHIYEFLDDLGINYVYLDHQEEFSMGDAADADEAIGVVGAKNVFLHDKKRRHYVLILVNGTKRVDLKKISELTGLKNLSFCNEEDLDTVLGLTPGAVTPFGLLNDKNGLVQLIIDETLRDEELFAMHPCVNTTTVRMSNRDFMEKVIPAMGHDPVFTEI
jgi:Ala-tRNA(Pro) deacylase